MQNVSKAGPDFNPLEEVSDFPSSVPDGLREFLCMVDLHHALERLEHTAVQERVTVEEYRTVEAKATQFFAELLKKYPSRIAREAQSAVANALFSLDFVNEPG